MSASCVTRCLTLRQSSCVTWLSTALRGWEAHSNAPFVSQVRQGGQDKPQRAWLDPEMTLGGFVKYCIPFPGKKKYCAWKHSNILCLKLGLALTSSSVAFDTKQHCQKHGPHNSKRLHYSLWLKGAMSFQVRDLQRMDCLLQALIHLSKGSWKTRWFMVCSQCWVKGSKGLIWPNCTTLWFCQLLSQRFLQAQFSYGGTFLTPVWEPARYSFPVDHLSCLISANDHGWSCFSRICRVHAKGCLLYSLQHSS